MADNKPVAYRYDDKGYYIGEITCQLDPLESKLAGKSIYLVPGESTLVKPLKGKEGFKVKWDSDSHKWFYEEVIVEKPEEYVPTEAEKLQMEISQKKGELYKSDYKAIKYAEGFISEEDYAPIKEERQNYRTQINQLEAEIVELEARLM